MVCLLFMDWVGDLTSSMITTGPYTTTSVPPLVEEGMKHMFVIKSTAMKE